MKLSLVISIEDTAFDAVAMRGRWEESVRMAAALGYDGVEIAVRDPARIDAATLDRTVRDAGVAVAAIGTGQSYLRDGLTLTSNDAGIRRRASERMAAHLRLAASCGAAVIVGLIRGRLAHDRATTDQRLTPALEELLEHAARHNVMLLLEPINRYETDYLNRIDEVIEILNRMASPRLGVLADTFHMNIEEASIEQALRRAGSRLGHVHVADSNRRAPGWGHLDFAGILAVLKEVGYRGYLSAEILPLPDPAEAAGQAVQHLRWLLEAAH